MLLPVQTTGVSRGVSYQSVVDGYRSDQQVVPQWWGGDAWDWLVDHAAGALSVACKASCATAGGLIAGGCITGSEGLATPECVAAGAAITNTCQALC